MLVQLFLAEVIAGSLAVLAIIGHPAWTGLTRWRVRHALGDAEQVLRQALAGDHAPDAAGRALARLPRRVAIDLVAGLAEDLSGQYHRRLRDSAVAAGLLARADRQCRSRRWSTRLRAVRLLTLLRAPSDAAPDLIDDRHVAVRAQAIEWAGARRDAALVDRLISHLDDDARVPRFAVHGALVRMGALAVAPLTRYLERPSSNRGTATALAVAAELVTPAFIPAARRLAADADSDVRVGAAVLLARIGGAEATRLLTDLLQDPAAPVRAVAARGLGSLQAWTSAPQLGRVMADTSWEVRRSAAFALRQLGGAGYVVLRRQLRQDDAFAADMARHVLELPPEVLPA